MKEWDVFVSHATEDKPLVVDPLTHALRGAGARVWLDSWEIRLGDSLREKIDEGLKGSRFGAVVLSPTLFAKPWAKRELDALFNLDNLLPIWHELDERELVKLSPLLAARKGVSTSAGIEKVAEALIDRLFSVQPSAVVEPRSLAKLLAEVPTKRELMQRLPDAALTVALSLNAEDTLRREVRLGDETVDFCAGRYQPSAGRYDDWRIILLEGVDDMLVAADGQPSRSVRNAIEKVTRIRAWVRSNMPAARQILPTLRDDFRANVIGGRRAQPGAAQAKSLAELNDSLVGVRVRTYDWLLDAVLREAAQRSTGTD